MSIQDLRARVTDVPGTESLSMALEGGRIILRWRGGYEASADAAASNAELERAVRNAAALPPSTLIPEKETAPVTTASPPGRPSGANPADTVSALDRVMQDHVRMMSDIHAAQLKILESTLARQRDSVATGVGTMAAQIDRQTDDFCAMMARWTNGVN